MIWSILDKNKDAKYLLVDWIAGDYQEHPPLESPWVPPHQLIIHQYLAELNR